MVTIPLPTPRILTFCGTSIGKFSPAFTVLGPMTWISVPTGALPPIWFSAFLIVLYAQALFATPEAFPLPEPVESEPFTGSTTQMFPATGSQAVHVLPTQAGVDGVLPHWVLSQQFPGTQLETALTVQQMSAEFAVHAEPG